MRIGKKYIPLWLAVACVIGALSLVSSLVRAEEPMDVLPYELKSTSDTLYTADSIIVINTVCAPICSSCARVYNKEWKWVRNITPPIKTVFPEAYIENDELRWRDNDTLDYTPCPDKR